MNEELFPCPFCGDSNLLITCDDFGWARFRIRSQAWWIQCQSGNCYAMQHGSTREKAIMRWNMRNENKDLTE